MLDDRTASALDERRLKACVIDRLLSSKHVDDDAVILTELTVGNWARRADIVLANGRLWGFEIKSERDRLVRLRGQLEAFTNYFEKFNLVVAERFENDAFTMSPDFVGIWVSDKSGNLVQRRPPKQKTLTRAGYLDHLTASDLRLLLVCNGLKIGGAMHRRDLVRLAQELSVSDLAQAARAAVKRRYVAIYRAFLQQKESLGTYNALPYLRRTRIEGPKLIREPNLAPLTSQIVATPDHPQYLDAPCGPILRRLVG
jgi:hypothetical protein